MLFIFMHILCTALEKGLYMISLNPHSILMKYIQKIWVLWGLNFKDCEDDYAWALAKGTLKLKLCCLHSTSSSHRHYYTNFSDEETET